MDMNYQQRAEYIEQCQREVDAQDAAHKRAALDHEIAMQCTVIETQLAISQLMGATLSQSRASAYGSAIMVAM